MITNTQSGQAPNTYMRQFFRYLGSRDELLNNTNESVTTLAELGGTHSIPDYCQFLKNAQDLFNDPAIGLELGRISQLSTLHGPVSTAIYNSPTLKDCLHIIQHYGSLRGRVINLHWVEEKDLFGMEVHFRESMGDQHHIVSEICLSIIFSMMTVVSRQDIQRFIMELDYPAPSYYKDYQQAFPVSSIRFSQTATRVLVPKHTANHETEIEPDLQLRASAIERCEELLRDAFQTTSIPAIVTQLFTDNPGQLWTQTDISKHLNMSVSTLQRRLRDENTHFQQLQNEWLMGETKHLLSDSKLTVESTALLLGYSDVSTFRKACRRWYGMSPNELRQSMF